MTHLVAGQLLEKQRHVERLRVSQHHGERRPHHLDVLPRRLLRRDVRGGAAHVPRVPVDGVQHVLAVRHGAVVGGAGQEEGVPGAYVERVKVVRLVPEFGALCI